jgi:hypothetical protein
MLTGKQRPLSPSGSIRGVPCVPSSGGNQRNGIRLFSSRSGVLSHSHS